MINPHDYVVVDGISFPEELIGLMYTQQELTRITDDTLMAFQRDVLHPLVIRYHPDARSDLAFITGHVHIGIEGVTPHDHLPYRFTSIFYMADAEGALVVDPHGDAELISPKAGRLVILRASVVHSVLKSPSDEMRVALVSNYTYPQFRKLVD